MTISETTRQGLELRSLSKLLFDRAVLQWYTAISLEIVAGLIPLITILTTFSLRGEVIIAFTGAFVLATAFYLKILFERTYDSAESMRRQSVFNEALGWSISKTQFSEWRRIAGDRLLRKLVSNGEDLEYFASRQDVGPRRLFEMTQESAFWTRHLYRGLEKYVWFGFTAATALLIAALTIAAAASLPESVALSIVYAVYLILPLVLTVNLLNWGIRLHRLAETIEGIEKDLERMEAESNCNEPQVLRLVDEYNCQLTAGFPIPGWFYQRMRNRINLLWDKR